MFPTNGSEDADEKPDDRPDRTGDEKADCSEYDADQAAHLASPLIWEL